MIDHLAIFLFYSCLAGIVEGILYGREGSATFRWNEHILFFLKVIAFGMVYLLPSDQPMLQKWIVIGTWWFMHSFFHDGFYYETRRQIDMPNYRWYFDYSKTSTARVELPFVIRIGLASTGLLAFTIYYLLK